MKSLVILVGIYLFLHILCIVLANDSGCYEKSISNRWLLAALPSSLKSNNDIAAVLAACSINIGAIFVLLYLIYCSLAHVQTVEHQLLFALYILGEFGVMFFMSYRKEHYLSKHIFAQWQRNVGRLLAYLYLVVSLIFSCFFVILFIGIFFPHVGIVEAISNILQKPLFP